MSQEPDSLAELHRIREAIYEEEKHLSAKERLERLRQETEAYLAQSGLDLKRASPPLPASHR